MEINTIRVEDQTPETIMELFGVNLRTAKLYLAIERGEYAGDAIYDESLTDGG